jgi:hypothetical protein
MRKPVLLPTIAAAVLAGCATVPPSGPSVMVLPGSYSNFDQFRHDQALCNQYALDTTGQTARQAAVDSAVNSAVAGAAVGAAAGALVGAASHDADEGAAAGAGIGLITGSAAGMAAYHHAAAEMQDRYDMAYVQCMYAKGHQVPLPAGYTAQPGPAPAPPQPATPPAPAPHALPPPPRS